ncbi:MAG: hypothetical protein Q8M03_10640 [Legionella sp.]|nr:hypothetical protein [Legionella sp.]
MDLTQIFKRAMSKRRSEIESESEDEQRENWSDEEPPKLQATNLNSNG